MGKRPRLSSGSLADLSKPSNNLTAPSVTFDVALASLFATSSGPVTAPNLHSTAQRPISKTEQPDSASLGSSPKPAQEDEVPESLGATSESLPGHDFTDLSESEEKVFHLPSKKRRRSASGDDIEGVYMTRLVEQENKEQSTGLDERAANRVKAVGVGTLTQEVNVEALEAEDQAEIPQHESQHGIPARDETEKSNRTVFLGNVSIEAIKSKSARKELVKHLSSCLSKLPSSGVLQKVESLRFRSTAFASGVGPRRAAYAKKELMEETTHSTNAYVVYTTAEAAIKAARSLNGTVVLDRYLRTDLVASPADIDHRRCVFVGNLGFVDEEMIETETESGEKERKRKAKNSADAEEGLWRTFSKIGKVESVRVVRDKATRVGKGIAYVQFHHENSVESALLYNDKKFPPLLPRKLRVTRAKKPKKALSGATLLGKGTERLYRKPGATKKSRETKTTSPVNGQKSGPGNVGLGFVFEGHRATKPAAQVGKNGQKKRKHAVKPTTRSSRRGAAFKAAGGKRQQG